LDIAQNVLHVPYHVALQQAAIAHKNRVSSMPHCLSSKHWQTIDHAF
jgi:hypothetical protein